MLKLIASISSLGMILAILLAVGALRNGAARDEAFAAIENLPPLARPAALPPDLPPLVAHHLLATAPAGRPPARLVHLEQVGWFRGAPDQGWAGLDARQVLRGDLPALAWSGRVSQNPLLWIWALDTLQEGRGRFDARLYGLFAAAQGQGPAVDASSLLRWLAEAPWLPGALAPRPGLAWSPGPEPGTARISLTQGQVQVAGVFYFDDRGLITRFVTSDRYRDQDGQFVRQDWETLYADWRDLGGGLIPTQGEARWLTPAGPFAYVRVQIRSARYR